MPIMQITDKEISLKNDKITLTLVDTTYEEQTKLIGESEGKTLETIESKNNLEAGLLSDIKNKQDEMHNKFETYINLIKENSLKWGFGEISVLTENEYGYLSLGIKDRSIRKMMKYGFSKFKCEKFIKLINEGN